MAYIPKQHEAVEGYLEEADGIIDGAEFTNYDYYIEPDEWIIPEDPAGMAKTMNSKIRICINANLSK